MVTAISLVASPTLRHRHPSFVMSCSFTNRGRLLADGPWVVCMRMALGRLLADGLWSSTDGPWFPKRVVYGWPVVVCGWPVVVDDLCRLRMALGSQNGSSTDGLWSSTDGPWSSTDGPWFPKRVVYGRPVVVYGWPLVPKTGRLRMARGRLRMARGRLRMARVPWPVVVYDGTKARGRLHGPVVWSRWPVVVYGWPVAVCGWPNRCTYVPVIRSATAMQIQGCCHARCCNDGCHRAEARGDSTVEDLGQLC